MNTQDGLSASGASRERPKTATGTTPRRTNQSNRGALHSQQRAGRWRSEGTFRRLRQMELSFSQGSSAYFKRAKPSNAELREYVLKDVRTDTRQQRNRRFNDQAHSIAAAERADVQVVRNLLAEWEAGGHGMVAEDKPDNTVRIMFENWNSIQLFTGTRKINLINALKKRYRVDVMAGVEVQTNWDFAEYDRQFYDLFGMGDLRKSVVSYNRLESFERSQPGGTAMMAFSRFATFVKERDVDPTKLGRWSHMLFSTPARKTRVVVAYNPTRTPIRLRQLATEGRTVWEQHERYFRKKGELRDPRTMFHVDLSSQLALWREKNEEIILFIDANENVYDGRFERRLKEADIRMVEQFEKTTGTQAPNSHKNGSKAICGCFASPGIICNDAFIAAHDAGAGDHRYHVYDFSAETILGEAFTTMAPSMGRNLNCRVARTRENYNKVVLQLAQRHKMFHKAEHLTDNQASLPAAEFQLLFNKWDRELEQLLHAAEKRCRKFKNNTLAFSPVIKFWLRRMGIYRWIQRFHNGQVPDPRNLFRSCRRHNISQPSTMTLEEAKNHEAACISQLDTLRKQAPKLRVQHLQDRLDDARKRNDRIAEKAILHILKREYNKKRWGIRRAKLAKPKGKPVVAIKISTGTEETLYNTEDDVVSHTNDILGSRFRLSLSAPMCSGQLFDDIGFLGDTPAAQSILEGTYVFPPGTDRHTRLLLEESAKIFTTMSVNDISKMVSLEDFQYWWRRAKEDTQSSKSGLHFGHYMAASYSDEVSSLHVAKFNLAMKSGVPLDRWGQGVTVLLEKIFGTIYVDKLRAICLFEADFNWLNKLVFAKRMMHEARARGVIPVEQFAKKNCTTSDGEMSKVFFNDGNRTLHWTSSITSVDLSQCYDRVAHPAASIALQAFGVDKIIVGLMLSCLQTMSFFLRTGFGISKTPYGGTKEKPSFGLGQGNGAAPPGFTAVSTLMINAYNNLGHGAQLHTVWTGALLAMSAILYVDDTDLLHRAKLSTTTIEDFHDAVQMAVMDWGRLVQATGGALKPDKCFYYLMDFKWVNGKAYMKTKSELPSTPMLIPQPDGPDVEIPLLEVTHAKKTLGVKGCPAGTADGHLEYMLEKANDWTSRLKSSKLHPRDGWVCFQAQLYPSFTWGLLSLTASIKELDKATHAVLFKCLSPLGVNKHIRKEFRTIPEMYQGLGMFDLNVESLSKKISFMMRHWQAPTMTGKSMQWALEIFQMDVGFSRGNFTRNFEKYGHLSEHSWFHVVWLLCWHFKVDLELEDIHSFPYGRHGDQELNDVFVDADVFTKPDLDTLNRVRRFKKVFFLSDLVLADGKSIDPAMLTSDEGISKRIFSKEKPTRRDLQLWKSALQVISSSTYTLQRQLGLLLRDPDRPHPWRYEQEADELYYLHTLDGTDYYDVYANDTSRRTTRGVNPYIWSYTVYGTPVHCQLMASISRLDLLTVSRHSTTPLPQPITPPHRLLDVLQSWDNQSLWENFSVDGDGTWIKLGLLRGSIIIVHDGSYMPKVHPMVCSAAFTILCTTTNQRATGTLVEKSDAAGNYRGELLGALGAMLVIKAATTQMHLPFHSVTGYCDNMGVVIHCADPHRALVEKQSQVDVLALLLKLMRELPPTMTTSYKHVKGHLDKHLREDQLSLEQRENVTADKLAKAALMAGVETENYINSYFPFESITMSVGGKKVTRSPKYELYSWWGYRTARDLFHNRHIVQKQHFGLIFWKGVERAMKKFPKMFRTWITKHVSHFCGTNLQLSRFDYGHSNECPSCGDKNESSKHINRCTESGRTDMFHHSIRDLQAWMEAHHTDDELSTIIVKYLTGRGNKSMTECLTFPSSYTLLAEYQDKLGWDNFLEGRILSLMVEEQRIHIKSCSTVFTVESWATGMIEHLLGITHKQWVYRNARVHLEKLDGHTEAEHAKIMSRIRVLLWTDPDSLMPRDRLLLEGDFSALGSGPAANRLYWIASMESALGAAAHERRRSRTISIQNTTPPTTLRTADIAPVVDSEGSIKYRRCRRRK